MTTFGINGFGRIGRTAFRVWWQQHGEELELKLINTSGSMDIEEWVHLLKYDSNYGVFPTPVSYQKLQTKDQVTDENPVLGTLLIAHKSILVTAQRDPAKIPWGKNGVEVVIDSTGVFITKEKALLHLQGGAKKVLISAPPKGEGIPTGIIGINTFSQADVVDSNASCTTNSVGPVAQVMHEVFGIKKAMLTTIHSYTDDQNLHDNSHKDMRRARAAAMNIVPTTTGAAIAVTEVIPELKGLFDGLAVRVPTPVGSLSDMVFILNRPTTKEEVNQALITASQSDHWRGILAVVDEPIVSHDIVGRSESSIVDLALTNVVDGDMVKVVAWYDNEFGYCCRLIEQVKNV